MLYIYGGLLTNFLVVVLNMVTFYTCLHSLLIIQLIHKMVINVKFLYSLPFVSYKSRLGTDKQFHIYYKIHIYNLFCMQQAFGFVEWKINLKFNFVRFQVFTAVTMKNGVFWDVTPCGSCKNRCFGGT
jgi:hypothetical protein